MRIECTTKQVTNKMSDQKDDNPSSDQIICQLTAEDVTLDVNRMVDSLTQCLARIEMQSKEDKQLRTGITFDDLMTSHSCLWDKEYEEKPERYTCIKNRLQELGLLDRCVKVQSEKARMEQLTRIHDPEYVEKIRSICSKDAALSESELEEASSHYDAVYFHRNTFDAALLAAGSAIKLTHSVLNGDLRDGFALIRPPGHHALSDAACGFCFFNNVAITAADVLETNKNVQRILIVDWDVHHGQATQFAFESDPRVMYVSIHRYQFAAFWPNLVQSDYFNVGKDDGLGYNVNVPLNETGINDRDYLSIFHNLILPLAYRFDPQLVLVSAGYDAAIGCPEGEMLLSPAVYGHLTHSLMALADGKVVVLLEGGYCLPSLAESAAMTVRSLLADHPIPRIDGLNQQVIHKSVVDSVLSTIYSLRPHHQLMFPLQGHFKKEEDQVTSGRKRHFPNPRPVVPEVTVPSEDRRYPTRGCNPIQDDDVKIRLLDEIDRLKRNTLLDNRFINKKRTGIAYNDLMRRHKSIKDPSHPERPSRISSIYNRLLERDLMTKCHLFNGLRLATDEEILLVHSEEYLESVQQVKNLSPKDMGKFAAKQDSIYLCQETEECARIAIGSLLNLVDAVMGQKEEEEILNGFAIIRPPGHHSRRDRMAGFCIFNNVAIAARYLINKYDVQKVLILDLDVHHGDGTQSLVQGDERIQFISIHRYDHSSFYPNDEASDIVKPDEECKKNIINIPFNDRIMETAEYLSAFFNIILPVAYDFDPQVILISAGFDAAINDPLGHYQVHPAFYGHVIHHLMPLAGGRIIAALEGGYNLESISESVFHCVTALNGLPLPALPLDQIEPDAHQVLKQVNDSQSSKWTSLLFGADLLDDNNSNNIDSDSSDD